MAAAGPVPLASLPPFGMRPQSPLVPPCLSPGNSWQFQWPQGAAGPGSPRSHQGMSRGSSCQLQQLPLGQGSSWQFPSQSAFRPGSALGSASSGALPYSGQSGTLGTGSLGAVAASGDPWQHQRPAAARAPEKHFQFFPTGPSGAGYGGNEPRPSAQSPMHPGCPASRGNSFHFQQPTGLSTCVEMSPPTPRCQRQRRASVPSQFYASKDTRFNDEVSNLPPPPPMQESNAAHRQPMVPPLNMPATQMPWAAPTDGSMGLPEPPPAQLCEDYESSVFQVAPPHESPGSNGIQNQSSGMEAHLQDLLEGQRALKRELQQARAEASASNSELEAMRQQRHEAQRQREEQQQQQHAVTPCGGAIDQVHDFSDRRDQLVPQPTEAPAAAAQHIPQSQPSGNVAPQAVAVPAPSAATQWGFCPVGAPPQQQSFSAATAAPGACATSSMAPSSVSGFVPRRGSPTRARNYPANMGYDGNMDTFNVMASALSSQAAQASALATHAAKITQGFRQPKQPKPSAFGC